jgi:Zn-finger domain-containing protein
MYSEFINLCDEIFNRSMSELNNYLHETACLSYSDKDEIKKSVLTSFCMFVNSDNLDPGMK